RIDLRADARAARHRRQRGRGGQRRAARRPRRALRALRPSVLLGGARALRQDRDGVPGMSIHTIDRIIRDRARITPGRVAIVEPERTWTYAELDARSDELAAGLRHGERVSTLTGNSGEHVALMFACAKAGAILHPISWRLAPAEVAYQLDDADPALFIVEDEHRELGEAALALASVRPALEPASNTVLQGH